VYTGPLRTLIDELGRLPGIGPKSAQRIAFHILKVPGEDARRLADAVIAVKERTTLCGVCFNVAESGELCAVCSDDRRDPEVICVVEDPRDIVAVERTGFKGRYHVLGGALSPLDGIGREQLRLRELLERVDAGIIRESETFLNALRDGTATAYNDQYMCMVAEFDTGDPRYAWLTQHLFVGEGRLAGDHRIEYRIHRVD